jgi:uncharacterized protein with GYD domain
MATFVMLVNWTNEGVRAFGDTVQRADDGAALIERMGGRMTSMYWTLGAYDMVATAEFPDDETATAAALAISSGGNVRTTTMRAFDRETMLGIIEKTP